MKIHLGHGYTVVWNGGHHVNYFDDKGYNYHCVYFAWEKNNPTFMDAWNAFYRAETEMV